MKLRSLGVFLRSNALGAVALFVALGGVSLAVTKSTYVAKNGTVHACVTRSGAVEFARVGHACARHTAVVVLNQKGVRGARGLQGLQGIQGIPGPTQASVSDTSTTDTPPSTGAARALGADLGTIVTKTSGQLLITATGSDFIQCGPAGSCEDQYGIYVDGHPVPHTLMVVHALANAGTLETPFSLEGLTGVLPPGAHTYTVEVQHSQFVVDGDAAGTHLWAVLIGG